MTSDACKATTKIDARFLLIRYRHDTPRSKVVTDAYRSSFGKSHNERTPKYDHKLAEIFDTPDGMLTNPKKVGRILEEIDIFTALLTTVKR
jgi:hypothetical protein